MQAVNEDSGQINVATMMETWTTQIGYPVVTINTTTGEISQKHFLFNDSAESRYILDKSQIHVLVKMFIMFLNVEWEC